jgi:hypothetical protein
METQEMMVKEAKTASPDLMLKLELNHRLTISALIAHQDQ